MTKGLPRDCRSLISKKDEEPHSHSHLMGQTIKTNDRMSRGILTDALHLAQEYVRISLHIATSFRLASTCLPEGRADDQGPAVTLTFEVIPFKTSYYAKSPRSGTRTRKPFPQVLGTCVSRLDSETKHLEFKNVGGGCSPLHV